MARAERRGVRAARAARASAAKAARAAAGGEGRALSEPGAGSPGTDAAASDSAASDAAASDSAAPDAGGAEPRAPREPGGRRALLLLMGGVLALLLTAVLLGLSDAGALKEQARGLRWDLAALGAALAVASYACIGMTQAALLDVLGVSVPRAFFVRASMVSVVVARTLRSGGASGLAFLALVLSRRGVPALATLSMGAANVMLNACVATAMVLVGIVLLATQPQAASRAAMLGYALGAGVLVAALLGAWLLLTRESLRGPLLRAAGWVAARMGRRLKRQGWGERLHESGDHVSEAARRVLREPRAAWRAWAWSLMRILVSLGSLAACARAAGVEVSAPSLLLAFTAMKLAGTLAFVPAGLGVVDGSLAGMLTLLGAPYEAALLTAAVHRVAYHVVPAIVALALAGPLLRDVLRKRA